MTDLKKAAQQALEALGKWSSGRDMDAVELNDLIATLEAALAQQEQEPVAWRYQNANTDHVYLVWNKGTGGRNWTPLYTAPPRREWRGLTMQEINALPEVGGRMWNMGSAVSVLRAIRAVEAALKEKNNG